MMKASLRRNSLQPWIQGSPKGWPTGRLSRVASATLLMTGIGCFASFFVSFFVSGAGCASAKDGESWSSKSRSTSTNPSNTPERLEARPAKPATTVAAAPTPAVPPTAPVPAADQRTPVEASSLRAQALVTLESASRSQWPQLRAHAIEALYAMPEFLDGPAGRGLVDENRGVRFVAAVTIARAKRCDLAHLVEPLLNDPSASVRAGAIAALVTCGQKVDQSPLAAMLHDESTEVRANAFVALGIIGNPSATGLVRSSVGKGMHLTDPVRVRVVELQAAECLVLLGDTQEIEPIRAALFAPAEQGELTALACQMVGRLRDERSRPLLERLLDASGDQARARELRLAAADALGRLGGRDVAGLLAVIVPYASAAEPTLRAQAATALGAVGSGSALPTLAALLADRDPQVQVAAAGAILVLTGAA